MTNPKILSKNNSPLWYKDAIIYELHVRSFFDSDADGVGDFPGLIDKLDYLEDLGVNAIWLLPFYPSPLKDDGYDISDYFGVLPAYGTIANFRSFIEEAHRRGIRVITELVINHTSSQHPWFQRARKAPKGSRYRNFYVWSDTAEKYPDARIIFTDTESSNWSWDPVAKQYYWHRFYSHQPDLNFDSVEVRHAIFRVIDFWLKTGVDGMRVDAIPYLYEREGTSCENLPETHAFVKELRKHIDISFKDRMLLAEANQWPEDTVAYFGNGDEFHMAFNFPVMPRLFMALHMEDRFPVIDILRETPPIPDSCQWALFLRNHDELTLEMVTDEERDYMYHVYASDDTARLNLGIRRRLAPLLGSDRRKIELMTGLLFSLPGTPIIYYGDEIGMGDNFYLGDRNGVRTPMQWRPERNAGFSEANPQKLFLPPIIDPEYHYEAVNVENQDNNPDSLLWWVKRLIALRKLYKTFGRGTIEFLEPENHKVLTYLRRDKDETILVVANLSHAVQQTALDLSEFSGHRPVDLFGRVEFAPITESKYYFTLSPYSFFWFSLEPAAQALTASPAKVAAAPAEVPELRLSEDSLFNKKSNWFIMEALLLEYVKERRWYRGKSREASMAGILDIVPIRFDDSTAYVTFLEVEYTEGEPETYVIPLTVVADDTGTAEKYPKAVVARLTPRSKNVRSLIFDAMVDARFTSYLLHAMQRRRVFRSASGEIILSPTDYLDNFAGTNLKNLEPAPVKGEQTNTSIYYSHQMVFKLFRVMEDDINPDVEMGRFLTENTSFTNIAPVAGSVEYRSGHAKPVSLGILQGYVPNEGDAWQYTLNTLERYFDLALAHPTVQAPPVPRQSLLSLSKELPSLAKDTIGSYIGSARLIGQRTAELHIALASAADNSTFAPVPFNMMHQISLYQSLRANATQAFQLLRERFTYLSEELQKEARVVLDLEKTVIERFNLIRREKISATRIRCHGDYHLGQVLFTGKDFVIIDFEGEPARSLIQRRIKSSPLRDVAGMIRSFNYAAHTALAKQTSIRDKPENTFPLLYQWAQFWYVWVSGAFLHTYLDVIGQTGLLPDNPDHLKILLDSYLLEKALYEVAYELNNRPDWLNVPLQGIQQILKAEY